MCKIIFILISKSKESTFKGHSDLVDQLCWHPSHSDLLVTASGDKTVRLYDCRAAKSIKTIDTPGIDYLKYLFLRSKYISQFKERILTFVGLQTENV
jgi:WD40 repeat protein